MKRVLTMFDRKTLVMISIREATFGCDAGRESVVSIFISEDLEFGKVWSESSLVKMKPKLKIGAQEKADRNMRRDWKVRERPVSI